MNELVVHHQYAAGSTFDLSRHSNHGIPNDVTVGVGGFGSSYLFANQNSRILVRPSSTLQNPLAIATMVRFCLQDAQMLQRHNLVEGHLSFALFVERGGALTGTILDANGNWRGASTGQGAVSPNVWHEAWLIHNGVSSIQIQLDGLVAGQDNSVLGPVRSVGPFGLSIGNWPDLGAYPFAGYIDEFKLYRYDPLKDLNSLLDHCCFDGRKVDGMLRTLQRNGLLTHGSADGISLFNLLFNTAVALSASAPDGQNHRTMQALWNASLRHDSAAIEAAFALFNKALAQNPNASQLGGWIKQAVAILAQHGMNAKTLESFAVALNSCLPKPKTDRRRAR